MRTILRQGKGSSVEIVRRKERKSREVEVEKYTNRRLVIVVVSTFLYTPYSPVLPHLPVTVTVTIAAACCWKEAFTAAMAVD